MTPLTLALVNFMGHRATTIDYTGARLTVFVGENGAGKSAATSEALEFALYGKSRLSPDDLVTWGESEMSVTLEFDHAGSLYRVTRGRSLRSGGKSYLELAAWDPAQPGAVRPLTGATIAETQAAIERLLGMDHATFRSSVLLKQADLARFARATAGERKRILGQVLGLDVYALAEARARELAREVDRQLNVSRVEEERLEEEVGRREGLDAEVAGRRERLAELDAEADHVRGLNVGERHRLGELTAEEATFAALGADVARLEAELATVATRYRTANERATSARGRLDAAPGAATDKALPLDQAEAAEARARAALDDARRAFDTEAEAARRAGAEAQAKRDGLVATVRELEGAMAGLEPVTCPKCRHTFAADSGHIADRLHRARQELLHLPEPRESLRLGTMRAQAARRQSDLDEAAKALQVARAADAQRALAAALEEVAAAAEAGKTTREALTRAKAGAGRLPELAAERRRVESAIATNEGILSSVSAERDSVNAALGRAEQALVAVDAAAARLEALDAARVTDQLELGRLRRLVTAFGANGIPARIIEGVLPEFATEANAILADTLPGWAVELRAQRARKGGEGMVEALDLVVLVEGTPRPFDAASGGQQTVIVLALALALSRLAGRRSGATIRYFGVDEPDGLDVHRRAMFGQALRALAHRGDLEAISLVTHNEDLAEYGDRVHRVSSNSHGSTVELVQ